MNIGIYFWRKSFFSSFTILSFSEFDARHATFFQIKVFGRKIKETTLSNIS